MTDDIRILDCVNDPQDLKALSCEELDILSNEIREEIVTTTSNVGGHVSSSLGAVEIIVAVHSLINSPKDKFIFDVGHQSYAHKLLTGRRSYFSSIRNYGGISGFTRPCESDHDVHYSGHSADSLSIAMGLAKAKKLLGTDEKIVVLIGDASIASGMSFEAINHIGQEKLPMTVILNDNRMSISEPVGAVGKHLRSLTLTHQYKDAVNAVKYGLLRLGTIGDFARKCANASKESFKHFLMPDAMIFEDLGITCLPTIDGHNIKALKESINNAINHDGPVMVHAITKKGAGYEPASKNPELFHGIGPFDVKTGLPVKNNSNTFTNAFSDSILQFAKEDNKIVALTAAMSVGTGLKNFEVKYPDRFIDCGIAEEHLIGTAAGLAKSGFKPVVAIYSAFLQRAIDQMITNIGIEGLNVTFCIDRAGLVGVDGVSHHGLMDMVYSKMIPNFTVIAPSCAFELKRALKTSLNKYGPFSIRYPKGEAADISVDGTLLDWNIEMDPKPLKIGKSRTLKNGNDLSILAFGSCVKDALLAHKMLKEDGIMARIVDMRFVKPLDVEVIIDAAKQTHKILTVEDGILDGGAGYSVEHQLIINNLSNDTVIKCLGIDDRFIPQGKIAELKKTVQIDPKSIYNAAISLIK